MLADRLQRLRPQSIDCLESTICIINSILHRCLRHAKHDRSIATALHAKNAAIIGLAKVPDALIEQVHDRQYYLVRFTGGAKAGQGFHILPASAAEAAVLGATGNQLEV
jgi:6-phosphogluconate dehydrogenase